MCNSCRSRKVLANEYKIGLDLFAKNAIQEFRPARGATRKRKRRTRAKFIISATLWPGCWPRSGHGKNGHNGKGCREAGFFEICELLVFVIYMRGATADQHPVPHDHRRENSKK